jgi:hypothetical protein
MKLLQENAAAAIEGVERIVASAEFRTSQRSVEFLRYVIRKWAEGDVEALRERVIAVEVFGRSTDYDPSSDSFVRVKAIDLRKRLAEYYKGSGVEDPLRIEMPVGSYQPVVTVRETPEAIQVSTAKHGELRRWLPWALGAVAALGAGWWWLGTRETALERFWGPFPQARRPVVLSLPTVPRHQVTQVVQRHIDNAEAIPAEHATAQHIHVKDEVVGMGAAVGVANVAALLSGLGVRFEIKVGGDLRYSDLRNGPAVLMGGMSSKWTMEETRERRFRMEYSTPPRVADTADPKRYWEVAGWRRNGRADKDYAILTRVVDSSSGQAVLVLGGITTFGTQAAADCALREMCLGEIYERAPREWKGRNLQAVISVRVKDDVPGPPKLEAVEFW